MNKHQHNRGRLRYGLTVKADRLRLLARDGTAGHFVSDIVNGLRYRRKVVAGETEAKPWDELLNLEQRLWVPIGMPQFVGKMCARRERRNIENETTVSIWKAPLLKRRRALARRIEDSRPPRNVTARLAAS
jgi:hypothetical protein